MKTSIEELSRFLTHEVSGTPTLERVIIPKELKPEFRKKLKSLGVTRNTVYWENKNGNNPHDLNELQQLVKNLKLDFGF